MPIAIWCRDAHSSRVQRGAASSHPLRSRPRQLNPRRSFCSRWVCSGTSPFGAGSSVGRVGGLSPSGSSSRGRSAVDRVGFRRRAAHDGARSAGSIGYERGVERERWRAEVNGPLSDGSRSSPRGGDAGETLPVGRWIAVESAGQACAGGKGMMDRRG
jgi:hypothetical protein